MEGIDAVVSYLILCIMVCNVAPGNGQTNFSVIDFGAIGDGTTDDSEAFLKAWEAVCRGSDNQDTTTMIVPTQKTFLLQPTTFMGPCNSTSIPIQVMGIIVAPNSTDQYWKEGELGTWIVFKDVANLSISGSGVIDGSGSSWWSISSTTQSNSTNGTNIFQYHRPKALSFQNCDNLELSGLSHINSALAHISIFYCNFVTLSNLTIIAPQDSPNTDGIDISYSNNLTIQHSLISTGDDCIAIGNASSFLNISNVICGPGHGISVGSLGVNGAFNTVEEVHVRNCTFNGTQNGARIKTWEGGSGYARRISFENITLIASRNPIIIDQHYCNGQICQSSIQETSVNVSEVIYSGFEGTSSNEEAIIFNCTMPGCLNIVMNQINITSLVPDKKVLASCTNVNGTSTSTFPNVPCLLGSCFL